MTLLTLEEKLRIYKLADLGLHPENIAGLMGISTVTVQKMFNHFIENWDLYYDNVIDINKDFNPLTFNQHETIPDIVVDALKAVNHV